MHNEEFADNHFIRTIIEEDLKNGKYQSIITRFPPEPNGYLHIGHAKSICLNFGLAHIYGGRCNLRFDDTNPEKESDEYVRSIKEDVAWLGFSWHEEHFASDYFDMLYQFAEDLIQAGKAYVDELTADEMRDYRGTLTQAGKESPYRNRSVAENLDLFRRMKSGEFEDGSKTLRLKIDMASGNLNLRDPVIYRIRRVHHHRTGDKWCIYPMYDYTHALSDAIEHITHSICTLEFEAHRPLYDWVVENVAAPSRPHQYEFSRLELLYSITSKRKLNQLVTQKFVSGWDDPRMPTISGMRRRGYTPAGLRLFAKRAGISKSENVVDMELLEGAIREDLQATAPRLMAVLKPLQIEITNYQDGEIQGKSAPYHPENAEFGERKLKLSPTIYIEQDDFAETPPKGFKRLTVGGEVRLRHSYIIKCNQVVKDGNGNIIKLLCTVDYDTLGKNPEDRKVKGVIHWLPETAPQATVRLYDRLFTVERPDSVRGEDGEYIDFIEFLNPNSIEEVTAKIEPIALTLPPESHWQFERLGYFVTDRWQHTQDKPVFNRTVTLRDSWKKK
ncbi:MAG: glutamine--tRNA ligase/YqeY domain fusion protein [Neisseriaceae bacterium]|nr:glutamine--tRNA ligase/YqeY domain fusion protein [Neisseriaceae bacterium]